MFENQKKESGRMCQFNMISQSSDSAIGIGPGGGMRVPGAVTNNIQGIQAHQTTDFNVVNYEYRDKVIHTDEEEEAVNDELDFCSEPRQVTARKSQAQIDLMISISDRSYGDQ